MLTEAPVGDGGGRDMGRGGGEGGGEREECRGKTRK
jgi:hypothetical protein